MASNQKENHYFVYIFICLVVFLIYGVKANAFEMNSADYRIQMGNVNIGGASNLESPTTKNLLSDTLGQTAAMEFATGGYILKAGFQYIHSIYPFAFTLSSSKIDFGDVFPNDPKTDTVDLSVDFGGGGQYLVTAAEQERLTTVDGANQIEDTCCDAGCASPSKCTESTATEWDLAATTGFGYKMSGEDVPTTFTTCGTKCYRPFPDLSTLENPVVVMSNTEVTVDLASRPKDTTHLSTMTFKLNVDPGQASGTYQTVINFTATPSY